MVRRYVAEQIAECRFGSGILLESGDFFCQFAAFLCQILLFFAQHPVTDKQGRAAKNRDKHDRNDQHECGD